MNQNQSIPIVVVDRRGSLASTRASRGTASPDLAHTTTRCHTPLTIPVDRPAPPLHQQQTLHASSSARSEPAAAAASLERNTDSPWGPAANALPAEVHGASGRMMMRALPPSSHTGGGALLAPLSRGASSSSIGAGDGLGDSSEWSMNFDAVGSGGNHTSLLELARNALHVEEQHRMLPASSAPIPSPDSLLSPPERFGNSNSSSGSSSSSVSASGSSPPETRPRLPMEPLGSVFSPTVSASSSAGAPGSTPGSSSFHSALNAPLQLNARGRKADAAMRAGGIPGIQLAGIAFESDDDDEIGEGIVFSGSRSSRVSGSDTRLLNPSTKGSRAQSAAVVPSSDLRNAPDRGSSASSGVRNSSSGDRRGAHAARSGGELGISTTHDRGAVLLTSELSTGNSSDTLGVSGGLVDDHLSGEERRGGAPSVLPRDHAAASETRTPQQQQQQVVMKHAPREAVSVSNIGHSMASLDNVHASEFTASSAITSTAADASTVGNVKPSEHHLKHHATRHGSADRHSSSAGTVPSPSLLMRNVASTSPSRISSGAPSSKTSTSSAPSSLGNQIARPGDLPLPEPAAVVSQHSPPSHPQLQLPSSSQAHSRSQPSHHQLQLAHHQEQQLHAGGGNNNGNSNSSSITANSGGGGGSGDGDLVVGVLHTVGEGDSEEDDDEEEDTNDGSGGSHVLAADLKLQQQQQQQAGDVPTSTLASAAASAAAGGSLSPRPIPFIRDANIRDDLVMLDIIGVGASASVQRAMHLPTLQMVAVKHLNMFDGDRRGEMASELRALSSNRARLVRRPFFADLSRNESAAGVEEEQQQQQPSTLPSTTRTASKQLEASSPPSDSLGSASLEGLVTLLADPQATSPKAQQARQALTRHASVRRVLSQPDLLLESSFGQDSSSSNSSSNSSGSAHQTAAGGPSTSTSVVSTAGGPRPRMPRALQLAPLPTEQLQLAPLPTEQLQLAPLPASGTTAEGDASKPLLPPQRLARVKSAGLSTPMDGHPLSPSSHNQHHLQSSQRLLGGSLSVSVRTPPPQSFATHHAHSSSSNWETSMGGTSSLTDDAYSSTGGGSTCPYIVRFYDSFCDARGNMDSLIVEYMGGGSLQDIVDAGGVQHEGVLARIATHMLRGLAHMHRTHQLHRDIKPGNILVSGGGDAFKIADFGNTAELEGTIAYAQTWVGTAIYMAPERMVRVWERERDGMRGK